MLYLLPETFLTGFNLKTYLITVHKLNDEILGENVSTKRRRVDRDMFCESRKPVYVMQTYMMKFRTKRRT